MRRCSCRAYSSFREGAASGKFLDTGFCSIVLLCPCIIVFGLVPRGEPPPPNVRDSPCGGAIVIGVLPAETLVPISPPRTPAKEPNEIGPEFRATPDIAVRPENGSSEFFISDCAGERELACGNAVVVPHKVVPHNVRPSLSR